MRIVISCAFLAALAACVSPAADRVRINQIQVIGSHNSYHAGLAPGEAAVLARNDPRTAANLDYRHAALDAQLSSGVRQVELDVWSDSAGGRFANPAGLRMVAAAGLPADPPFDPQGVMKKPGFKVLHMQDIDYRVTCQPFTACLGVILNWSNAHPGHLPIFLLIENKDERPRPEFQVEPELFTAATFDALDREVLSVIPRDRIVTPDDVRGRRATLEAAVLKDGWPTLASARGKFVFLLDQRRAGPAYLKGHPSLKGRVMFTNAEPGSPDAAFVEVNDPLEKPGFIPGLVRKGYLVRTRTDAELKEAHAGDATRKNAAFASGAQLLSSDFPFEERDAKSGYAVAFPEGTLARCNPVSKAVGCVAANLEPKP